MDRKLTLTHGGMVYGAGMIAAQMYHAAEIIDPRSYAVGTLRETYQTSPHIGPVLPAMGYSPAQIRDLEITINNAGCDLVLFASPIKLNKLLSITFPTLRVFYEYSDHCRSDLESILFTFLDSLNL